MMQVNNKFNIGDKVYFIDSNNKAKCDEVTGIFVFARTNSTQVTYNLKDTAPSVNEEQAFATESELKQYVFNDLIEFV